MQVDFPDGVPTSKTSDIPPEAKPDLSDITARKVFFSENGNCTSNDPLPFLKFDEGMLNMRCEPNVYTRYKLGEIEIETDALTGSRVSSKGGCPPGRPITIVE